MISGLSCRQFIAGDRGGKIVLSEVAESMVGVSACVEPSEMEWGDE